MPNTRPDGNGAALVDLENDERRRLVERIIQSSPFRRAGRLRDLLRYLAEMSIRGQSPDLTEQRVGEAVFGKPHGYSPVEDSSVRVHVRQLRLKLHEYFDSDGKDEKLVVEIPKGGYTLLFHSVRAQAAIIPPPFALVAKEPPGIVWWRRAFVPWAIATALAVACASLWVRSMSPAREQPAWPLSTVFGNGYRTQIIVADASWALLRRLNHDPVSLESYIRRDFQREPDLTKLDASEADIRQHLAQALLTSNADMSVITILLRVLKSNFDQVLVRSARDLRPRDLEEGNYIFVGSPTSNPWVLLFEKQLNFEEVRTAEESGSPKYFRNRNPRSGEQDVYQGVLRTGGDEDDYASIAALPLNSRRGNVLIIQGLQQEGTEGAGLFLASEGGQKQLRAALGSSTDPAYFEALLRIHAVGGSPSSTSIVGARVIPR